MNDAMSSVTVRVDVQEVLRLVNVLLDPPIVVTPINLVAICTEFRDLDNRSYMPVLDRT